MKQRLCLFVGNALVGCTKAPINGLVLITDAKLRMVNRTAGLAALIAMGNVNAKSHDFRPRLLLPKNS
ncbi:MAG TPA: hypothetical protein VK737_03345 [Opitutales bacterium]|nr:hypothetical protein [Opitutales bacterium]